MIKNRKVLVVEDDAGVRWTLVEMLEPLGLEVVQACNGLEALDLLRERPAFDLVVTDLLMPSMGGAELIRIAREQDDAVAFAVHSGSVTSKAACGIPDDVPVFNKPDGWDDLVAYVRKFMGRAA